MQDLIKKKTKKNMWAINAEEKCITFLQGFYFVNKRIM